MNIFLLILMGLILGLAGYYLGHKSSDRSLQFLQEDNGNFSWMRLACSLILAVFLFNWIWTTIVLKQSYIPSWPLVAIVGAALILKWLQKIVEKDPDISSKTLALIKEILKYVLTKENLGYLGRGFYAEMTSKKRDPDSAAE